MQTKRRFEKYVQLEIAGQVDRENVFENIQFSLIGNS
tara:strand:+ start:1662 stop:1772 length:111 start_codon:yes stop_codon:yes gene_type:complete